MKVEVDVSDIPLGSYYTDERSKRVERIIQDKEEYAKFRVKRYRQEEDFTLDIYIMMDETENYWVWMYEWEVDVLSDEEILSYVTVTKETSQRPDPTKNLGILMSLFAAFFFSFLILMFIPGFSTNEIVIGIVCISLIGTVISGWIFRGKDRVHMQSERKFEITTMTRHPLFFESIRKFTALNDISESQREIYHKRIREIKAKMAD